MRVGKWGDSLAITLPSDVVEALNLQEGDEVRVELAKGRSLRIARYEERAAEAFAVLSALAVTMPKGFKFSREEATLVTETASESLF